MKLVVVAWHLASSRQNQRNWLMPPGNPQADFVDSITRAEPSKGPQRSSEDSDPRPTPKPCMSCRPHAFTAKLPTSTDCPVSDMDVATCTKCAYC